MLVRHEIFVEKMKDDSRKEREEMEAHWQEEREA
jgi:hypothetical protein